MKRMLADMRLLMAGAAHRLAGTAVIVALLWLAFFWATGALGAA